MNNINGFLELLPNELRQAYIKDLVQNKGFISDHIWSEVSSCLIKEFKEAENYKLLLKQIFKEAKPNEREFIKEELEKSGEDILNDMQDILLDLEDVLALDKILVKKALYGMEKLELVKACYIASPHVSAYFQSIYPDTDFNAIRKQIGNISIDEAVEANKKVINRININY